MLVTANSICEWFDRRMRSPVKDIFRRFVKIVRKHYQRCLLGLSPHPQGVPRSPHHTAPLLCLFSVVRNTYNPWIFIMKLHSPNVVEVPE
jgi:hypothetical protein